MKQAQSTSIVSEILETLPEEINTPEEQVDESEVEEPEIEQDKPAESQITEEFARQYGLATWMIGKPMSELGRAYKNLNTDYTKKNKERSEIEKRLGQLEQQQLSQAMTKAEKLEVKDVFENMPDPLENPKEFKSFLKNALKNAETEAEKNLLGKIQKEISPQIGQIQQFTQNQRIQQISEQLQSVIPEGVNLDELVISWGQENELIGDLDAIDYFISKPKIMVNSILKFYEAKQYNELKSNVDKEVKEKSAQELVKNIKSVKSKKTSDLNTQIRTKDDSESSQLVKDILENLEE
jgi:hypothetical protein